jgi:segregation and condensation protein B
MDEQQPISQNQTGQSLDLQKEFNEKKKKVESILFATGRFCELDELIKFVLVKDKRELRKILHEIQEEYDKRNSPIRIIEQDDEFKMVIRDQYLEIIRNVLSNMEISKAVLETLAIIAWKKTILQADVIKIRGNSAYEHIRELEDMDFITSIKEGVSRKLTLTQKFYDYFNLGGEDMTNKMRREEQERLSILEEEVKKKEEEERRVKEEERQKKILGRQSEIEKKKIALGIADKQKTIAQTVVDKKIEQYEQKAEQATHHHEQPSQQQNEQK